MSRENHVLPGTGSGQQSLDDLDDDQGGDGDGDDLDDDQAGG